MILDKLKSSQSLLSNSFVKNSEQNKDVAVQKNFGEGVTKELKCLKSIKNQTV
jgi:hypothetical protein